MTRQKAVLASAAAALALFATIGPATAVADRGGSCVGRLASADAGPGYGQVIATFTRIVHPFGSAVSDNATSDTSECPYTP